MENKYKQIIAENINYLAINTVNIPVLSILLSDKRVLTASEYEAINSHGTNFGKSEQLFSMMLQKSMVDIHWFIKCLASSENKTVLKKLQDNAAELTNLTEFIWFDVPSVTKIYIQRESEFTEIYNCLKMGYTDYHLNVVGITGLGGIGKSELAINFAHFFREKIQGHCVWINAKSAQKIYGQLQKLAAIINISLKHETGISKNIETLTLDICKYLCQEKCLFIFDNIGCYNLTVIKTLFDYATRLPPFQLRPLVIITSRNKKFHRFFGVKATRIHLPVLPEESSFQLFRKGFNITDLTHETEQLIRFVCQKLNCIPLALQQALAYMKNENQYETVESKMQSFLNRFDSDCEFLLKYCSDEHGYNNCASVYSSWNQMIHAIVKASESRAMAMTAKNILNIISLLHPDNIDMEFINDLVGLSTKTSDVFEMLNDYSLYQMQKSKGKTFISVHSLVQKFLQCKMKEENKMSSCLDKLLKMVKKMMNEDNISSFAMVHVQTLWLHASEIKHVVKKYQKPQKILKCETKTVEMKPLNILLLGKSGVGKSTFINSFANYVAYENVNEIKDKNFIRAPIPCSFGLYDGDGKFKNFKMGEKLNIDQNESMNPLKSGTQGCKAYQFNFNTLRVCLIDTPGIVDTEGIDKDRKNLEDILEFLSVIPSIDCICLLLKPNEERLDPVLRYCILELLSQLDSSAAQNIVFAFTNARGTLYRSGSTGSAIDEMLREINEEKPELNLQFSSENYFCFDSEAFRYLVCREEMEFDEFETSTFVQSWTKSRNECIRMIKFIAGLPGHNIQNTLSIIKARKIIECLLPLIVDITENIMKNQQLCENQERDIKAAKRDVKQLISKLYIPRSKILIQHFSTPSLICGSKNCIRVLQHGKKENTHYKTICYQVDAITSASGAITDSIGAVTLGAAAVTTGMAAMAPAAVVIGGAVFATMGAAAIYYWKNGGLCTKCGCSVMDHFLAYYETREEEEKVIDEDTLLKIENEEDAIRWAKIYLDRLRREQQALKTESDYVNEASNAFAVFLKYRAIAAYNNATEGYLNYLMEVYNTATWITDEERTRKRNRLEEQKRQFLHTKKAIEKGDKNRSSLPVDQIDPDHIKKIVDELCNLKRYGHMFKASIGKSQHMRENDNEARIINCNVAKPMSSLF